MSQYPAQLHFVAEHRVVILLRWVWWWEKNRERNFSVRQNSFTVPKLRMCLWQSPLPVYTTNSSS